MRGGSGTVRTPEGEKPLRYLALGTRQNPEVPGYPDSGKYGPLVDGAPGEDLAVHARGFKKGRMGCWAEEG